MVDDHGRVIEEKIYKTGSTIELKCVVSKVPGPTANIMWRHGLRILNYDTSRGGIRWAFPPLHFVPLCVHSSFDYVLHLFHLLLIKCQNRPVALRRRQPPLHRQRQSTRRRQLHVQHLRVIVDDGRGPHPERYAHVKDTQHKRASTIMGWYLIVQFDVE